MFGYVNILKDELKVKDYMLFRSYYCGLCRSMGKNCSQISRFGLSYDMTFLAILLSSLSPEPLLEKEGRCMAHPINKRKYIACESAVDYAANVSVILYYCKMKDDWHDDGSFKALIGLALYRGAYKKAAKKYPELSEKINEHLRELSYFERQKVSDIDLTADCFAKITQDLFSPDFIGENRRPAAWLGYNIGRWIYVIDAFTDIDSDFKNKKYNPFLAGFEGKDIEVYKKKLADDLSVSLTFTLENAASGYDLMKIYKNDEILKNILFLSLKVRQDSILADRSLTKDV